MDVQHIHVASRARSDRYYVQSDSNVWRALGAHVCRCDGVPQCTASATTCPRAPSNAGNIDWHARELFIEAGTTTVENSVEALELVPIHVVRADVPPEPQENTHMYFYRREYYPRNSSICELAPLGGAPMDVEGTEDNAPPPPPPAAAAPDAAPAAARKPSGRVALKDRLFALETEVMEMKQSLAGLASLAERVRMLPGRMRTHRPAPARGVSTESAASCRK